MIVLTKSIHKNRKNIVDTSTIRSIRIVLLLLIMLFSKNLLCQFYPAKLYSLRDGMPTNSIYDITQSTDGIMWFLTSKGIVTYNSLNWNLYPDSLQLPNSPYSFLKSRDDGSIWVAGQNSNGFIISYFKNEKWHRIDLEGIIEISDKFTFDVKTINKGYSIVFGEDRDLTIFNTATNGITKIPLSDHPSFSINAVSFKNDTIYISTSQGLLLYKESLKSHVVNTLLEEKKEILQIEWKNDGLYLLGKNWLGIYKNNELQYLSKNTGVPANSHFNKHNLTIDQFGRVFFSSMSSARYLNTASGKSEILYVNGRIFNAQSNKIFVDTENNIWVGDHRGLFKFNVLRFQNYNENIGLANDEVTAISRYKNQLVLANDHHLNFLEQGTVKKSLPLQYKKRIRILDLANDGKDTLFIAANSAGLQKYDGVEITTIDLPNPGKNSTVTSVEYINEKLFFSTNRSLYSYNNGNITMEAEVPGIRNISYLQTDSLVALSTTSDLYLFSLKSRKIQTFTSGSLNYKNVYNVIKWSNQYFVGTSGGLAIIKNNKIVPYFTSEKLNRVAVYSLFVSTNNKLWIGTNEGIFIWDGNKLVNYNRSHGLVGDEINRNAFLQINQEKVWIGTELGASVYDFNQDISVNIIPNLQITKASTIEGQKFNRSTENNIKYDNNTIEFQFIGVSFFDENQIKYRYKLTGFDNEYIYINNPNSNSVRYTNLPPKTYAFQVESSIDSNHWSTPESINFTIERPYYLTYWFLTSLTLAIIIILYSIYRIRFYFILKNQKTLKKEVALRTKEILEMNNEIQAQNEELINQSEEIATNNERLEEIVQDRTQKLKEQNDRLSKYAFMNSHELRGPICRMIGLLNLLKISKIEEHKNILNLIQETGAELDAITKQINYILDDVDLNGLYESNSIEIINAEIKAKEEPAK